MSATLPYSLLRRVFPTRPDPPPDPHRIVLILPCCIGDVVLATATLKALRRGYPQAHITWAVGSWSRPAIEQHDLLDAVLDLGAAALPVKSPGGLLRCASLLRAGRYDLAVSLVRSPLMSAAVWLAGIPWRAGLDSAGRGFGYNLRAPIDPDKPRHEAQIYLDVPRVLGLSTQDCYANVPVSPADAAAIHERLGSMSYMVINPAGGRNPGMLMDSKRWPLENFAALADRLAERLGLDCVVLIGGPGDEALVAALESQVKTQTLALAGELSFGQIAALARAARLYVGNDTGLTHLAAAAGASTVMILGPSDPARYAPFTPDSIALWKPAALRRGGVAAGTPADWDWSRDGISVDEAERRILAFIGED